MNIVQKAHDLRKSYYWSDKPYSTVDRYRHIKSERNLEDYFQQPLQTETVTENTYVDVDKPFDFVVLGRKFTATITAEVDEYLELNDIGMYGEFVSEIPEGIHHSIKARYLNYYRYDRKEKYYIPYDYCKTVHGGSSGRRRTYFDPQGADETFKYFNKYQSKQKAFKSVMDCHQREYDYLCDLLDGNIIPSVITASITVNDTPHILGSSCISGVLLGSGYYSNLDDPLVLNERIEEIVCEYGLIDCAYEQATSAIAKIIAPKSVTL